MFTKTPPQWEPSEGGSRGGLGGGRPGGWGAAAAAPVPALMARVAGVTGDRRAVTARIPAA